ncbi:transcription initiation factor IIB [Halalkalicoccus tibetensis]|uniref:Transcription initiation factor IIB n=1 Tax=Halalkalicoccus tibetensis TaxID=175632 RepID=A0ABD5V5M7_9EURY
MTHTTLTTKDDRTDEQTQASASQSVSSCPECGGQIVSDDEHGEDACEECGLVLDADTIDHGPEWRASNPRERDEKSRVGTPTTHLMHDKGLSTTIGWQNKDASGRIVGAEKRAKLERLRQWDERFRTKNAHERNLKQAFGEIRRMASALGLPQPVRETAAIIYRRAVEKDLLPGRSIEAMSTASLYAAARQHQVPRTLDDCAAVSRVEQLPIQRAYWYLSRELGLQIKPTDPIQYVSQFGSELDLSDNVLRQARELLTVAKDQNAHSGRKPAGLAAGALYAASRLANENLTQITVSQATDVSRMTIRARYQELLEIYGAEGNTT